METAAIWNVTANGKNFYLEFESDTAERSPFDTLKKKRPGQRPDWVYYNHAMIPTVAPHKTVDESPLRNKGFWQSANGDGFPLFARWTSDYDCKEPTGWWFMVKDKPFDFMDVHKTYRRKIRRGLKNFDIMVIDPTAYAEELYHIEREALASYPSKTRLKLDHDQFIAEMRNRRDGVTIAAFSKEDGSLAGYCYDIVYDDYILASVQTARPSQEIKHLNAALAYSELDHFKKELAAGVYLMAGERTMHHRTNFQDYLEKYFGFRKVYSKLHIAYRPGVKPIVDFLYKIRGIMKYLDGIKIFYQINCVLRMESIVRSQQNPVGT